MILCPTGSEAFEGCDCAYFNPAPFWFLMRTCGSLGSMGWREVSKVDVSRPGYALVSKP